MMLVLAIVEIFSVILQRIFCDSTLKKKKIRRYTDYLVWGGYFAVFNGVTYVLTYLGDGTSNIWLNILLFVCIFFVTIRILYTDSVRTLMATTIFMYMSGMCAELQSSPNLCVHSSSSYVSPSMLPLSSGDLIEWSLVCHSTLSYQKFCDRHSNHYDHPEELHQSVE